MNCPYCGKPLERGKLSNRRLDFGVGLVWLPENEKDPFVPSKANIRKHNGFILDESDYISVKGRYITAYICRECRKGIFELDRYL